MTPLPTHHAFLCGLTCVGVLGGACQRLEARREEARINAAAQEAQQIASGLHLPRVRLARPLPAPDPLRVIVSAKSIRVDNASWLAARPEQLGPILHGLDAKAREQLLVEKTGIALPEPDTTDFMIAPLFDALREAVDVEKRLGKLTATAFRGRITLYVDGAISFSLLTRVLYSAGMAELSSFSLVVETPSGPGALEIAAPRFCGPSQTGNEPICASPFLQLMPHGIWINVQRLVKNREGCFGGLGQVLDNEVSDAFAGLEGESIGLGGTTDGLNNPPSKKTPTRPLRRKRRVPKKRPAPPTDPDWSGRPLLGPGRSCPPVGRKGGGYDTAALHALLATLAQKTPGCHSATLSADPTLSWSEVAAVLSEVTLGAGRSYAYLSVSLTGAVSPTCSDGLLPEEISVP